MEKEEQEMLQEEGNMLQAGRVHQWIDTSKTNTQKVISCSIGLEIFDMDWEYNKKAYLLISLNYKTHTTMIYKAIR